MYIHLTDGQICQTLISVGSIVNLKKKTRTVGTGEYSSNVGFKDKSDGRFLLVFYSSRNGWLLGSVHASRNQKSFVQHPAAVPSVDERAPIYPRLNDS